MKRDYKEKTK